MFQTHDELPKPPAVIDGVPVVGRTSGIRWQVSPFVVWPLPDHLADLESQIGPDDQGREPQVFGCHDIDMAYKLVLLASLLRHAAGSSLDSVKPVYPRGPLGHLPPGQLFETLVDDETAVVVWLLSEFVTASDMAAMKPPCKKRGIWSVLHCDDGEGRTRTGLDACKFVDITTITPSARESISPVSETVVIVVFDEELSRTVQQLLAAPDSFGLGRSGPLTTAEEQALTGLSQWLELHGGPWRLGEDLSRSGVTLEYWPAGSAWGPVPASAAARAVSAELNVPVKTRVGPQPVPFTLYIPLKSLEDEVIALLQAALAKLVPWGSVETFQTWAQGYVELVRRAESTDPTDF